MNHAEDAWAASWAIQEAASAAGFDWPDIAGVFAKVREELGEIEEAWAAGDREHAKRELGDLLFATVNLGRFLDASPGAELARTNARFTARFTRLQEELKLQGRLLEQCTLAEMDVVWEQIKAGDDHAKKRA